MAVSSKVLPTSAITGRGSSVNPFIVIEDAVAFVDFAVAVFGAREVTDARTTTPTGRLIHAELALGDSMLLLSDPQEGWPSRPGLLQVWVSDIEPILSSAEAFGSTVVTAPTPFYGEVTLARLGDRWGNLWWIYQPSPGQEDPVPVWEGGSELVFRSIDEYMRGLSR